MPLDPANAAFFAQITRARTRAITEMTPAEVRAGTARLRPLYGAGPEMHRVDEVRVGHGEQAFAIRVLVPQGHVQGLIVYFHGGGWVTGHIDDFDTLARKLAERSRCAVLLVDYRLAPEHPFPAAVDDARAALRWADAHVESIVGRRVPLILLGDSAGGTLATVAARHARDAGPAVAMQVLVYPAVDADFDRPSYTDPQNQLALDRHVMRWYWNHYLPDAAARQHADASPLHAADLAGLPPALVLTAEHDPLRDEGEAYAAKLGAAGVAVECERYLGQMHGFFTLVNVLPEGERALAHIARAIEARLAR